MWSGKYTCIVGIAGIALFPVRTYYTLRCRETEYEIEYNTNIAWVTNKYSV